ncbi:YceI family protein [Luteococcus sp. Sow4_B9]|uniref:YceI family protein n=1 Tax=Luteococcus sp. Sow4_B9 TaxID=3438792 RepID=UPI003F9DFC36
MTDMTSLKGTYALDPTHSTVGFVARHAMITKVRGSVKEFEGLATVDGQNPDASSVNVTMQVASIDTRNGDRDGHLVSGDFFDAEKFPTITFTSTKVEVTDADSVEITGDLTIKDVTKSVTVPFEFTGAATDPFGNERIGFEGKTEVNRRDFGLTWNAALDTGGVLVSEKIVLEFEISAIKQA